MTIYCPTHLMTPKTKRVVNGETEEWVCEKCRNRRLAYESGQLATVVSGP